MKAKFTALSYCIVVNNLYTKYKLIINIFTQNRRTAWVPAVLKFLQILKKEGGSKYWFYNTYIKTYL